MAGEISLIREYEAIIRTMKEQISVLKNKLKAENRSFSLDNASVTDCNRSQLSVLSQKAQEAESLATELRSANELIRKLNSEKRGLQQKLETSTVRSRDDSFAVQDYTGEAQVQRLKNQIQTLLTENTELKQTMEISTAHVRYEDLNTTQKARYMIMERKVRIIETENRVLKEKIVSSELERRQASEKQATMLLQLQELESMKTKLKRLNEDLKTKDALIASMTEKMQSAMRRKVDIDLTKEHLDDYKAHLSSSRSSLSACSPQRSPSALLSTDSTEQRLKEIALQLRKTQEEVAQLKKTGAYGAPQWGEWDRRTNSPGNSSCELSSFDEGRQPERVRGKTADVPRSPPHTDMKPLPTQKSVEEKPILSRLQMVRSMKKPGVSLFSPSPAVRKSPQELLKPSRSRLGMR